MGRKQVGKLNEQLNNHLQYYIFLKDRYEGFGSTRPHWLTMDERSNIEASALDYAIYLTKLELKGLNK